MQETTPRKRVTSSLQRKNSILEAILLFSASKVKKKPSQFQPLLQKFMKADSLIDIDSSKVNFNLVNFQALKQKKMLGKIDAQMQLRKLENRAQIKRVQRQIDNREKKFRHRSVHKKAANLDYKEIYTDYLKHKDLVDFNDESQNQSQDDANETEGIKYYHHLKKYPHILDYTRQKKYQKSRQGLKKLEMSMQMIQSLLDTKNKQHLQEFKMISDEKKKQALQSYNPQETIDSLYKKFFSQKRTDKLSPDVKKKQRCNRMMQRQSDILSQITQRSISKQNKKKLQSRFNQIVNQIAKNERTQLQKRKTMGINFYKSQSNR